MTESATTNDASAPFLHSCADCCRRGLVPIALSTRAARDIGWCLATIVNLRLFQTLATAACAIAAIYLLSILVTGGYSVNLAVIRFEAIKLWPAIIAILGFALLPGRARQRKRDHGRCAR